MSVQVAEYTPGVDIRPPATWTDLAQLEKMIAAFSEIADDDALVLVPTTRHELMTLSTAFGDRLGGLANKRILQLFLADLRTRAIALDDVPSADLADDRWPEFIRRAVGRYLMGAAELMWTRDWMAENREAWFAGDAGRGHWTIDLSDDIATTWRRLQPESSAPGTPEPVDPVLVPIGISELAALHAGAQVSAPVSSVIAIRLFFNDWQARMKELDAVDAETVRRLIRDHATGAQWCEAPPIPYPGEEFTRDF